MVQQRPQATTRCLDLGGQQPFDHAATETPAVMEPHDEFGHPSRGKELHIKGPVSMVTAIELHPLEPDVVLGVDGPDHPETLRAGERTDLGPQFDLPCSIGTIDRLRPRHDREPFRVPIEGPDQRSDPFG